MAGYSSLVAVGRKQHLVADPTAAAAVEESVFGPAYLLLGEVVVEEAEGVV